MNVCQKRVKIDFFSKALKKQKAIQTHLIEMDEGLGVQYVRKEEVQLSRGSSQT